MFLVPAAGGRREAEPSADVRDGTGKIRHGVRERGAPDDAEDAGNGFLGRRRSGDRLPAGFFVQAARAADREAGRKPAQRPKGGEAAKDPARCGKALHAAKAAQHRRGIGEAICGIRFQKRVEERVPCAGKVAGIKCRRLARRSRTAAREGAVEHRSERIPVERRSVRPGRRIELFRGGIGRGAEEFPAAGGIDGKGRRFRPGSDPAVRILRELRGLRAGHFPSARELRESEIGENGAARGVVEDVGRFDVAVDDPGAVRGGERGAGDVARKAQHGRFRQRRAAVEEIGEGKRSL